MLNVGDACEIRVGDRFVPGRVTKAWNVADNGIRWYEATESGEPFTPWGLLNEERGTIRPAKES